MGGRRSARIREVFGAGNISEKRKLTNDINNRDYKQMSLSSFNLVFSSKESKLGITKALKLSERVSDFVKENRIFKKEDSEKIATNIWVSMKSEEKFDVPSKIDKFVVSIATNILRRRGK